MEQLEHLDVVGKRVVMRVDFNVPLASNQHILDDYRIVAVVPTIRDILAKGATQIVLLSHLGRPQPGEDNSRYSLAPIAQHLESLLGIKVGFLVDFLDNAVNFDQLPYKIILCENIRVIPGEIENSPALSKQLAALGDVFVMEAFSCAHRKHASTCGVIKYAKQVAQGTLLARELQALDKILHADSQQSTNTIAIIGGAKISTKLQLLNNLLDKLQVLVVGGGIANTLLAAQHIDIGNSLYEAAMLPVARKLLAQAAIKNTEIILPTDVVVNDKFNSVKDINALTATDSIFDIGPRSIDNIITIIQQAQQILWNGPLGVFEQPGFERGTQQIAQAIAASTAYTVAGGGETIAAIRKFKVAEQISYISTGGGAFLYYLQSGSLPILEY